MVPELLDPLLCKGRLNACLGARKLSVSLEAALSESFSGDLLYRVLVIQAPVQKRFGDFEHHFIGSCGVVFVPPVAGNGRIFVEPVDAATQRAEEEAASIAADPAGLRSMKFNRAILPFQSVAGGSLQAGGLAFPEAKPDKEISIIVIGVQAPKVHLLIEESRQITEGGCPIGAGWDRHEGRKALKRPSYNQIAISGFEEIQPFKMHGIAVQPRTAL